MFIYMILYMEKNVKYMWYWIRCGLYEKDEKITVISNYSQKNSLTNSYFRIKRLYVKCVLLCTFCCPH